MGLIPALILVTLVSGHVINAKYIKHYKMPAPCVNLTYCTEKGPDYPSKSELINALKYSDLRQIIPKEPEIADRVGGGCSAQYENATIYYIRDIENKAVYPVIQLKQYFAQYHELRYCNKIGYKSCNQETMATISVDLICENQYMASEFLVVNGRGEVQSKQASIPVCCKCTYDPAHKMLY